VTATDQSAQLQSTVYIHHARFLDALASPTPSSLPLEGRRLPHPPTRLRCDEQTRPPTPHLPPHPPYPRRSPPAFCTVLRTHTSFPTQRIRLDNLSPKPCQPKHSHSPWSSSSSTPSQPVSRPTDHQYSAVRLHHLLPPAVVEVVEELRAHPSPA
jgi:hypothetical protein